MTRAHDPGGFSFQLSESAPPVDTEELTPAGELDLDMEDFGPGFELSSHAPAVVAPPDEDSFSIAQREDEPMFVFTAPPSAPELATTGMAQERAPQITAAQPAPATQPQSAPSARTAPSAVPASRRAQPEPPAAAKRAAPIQAVAAASDRNLKKQADSTAAPTIKKINFPARVKGKAPSVAPKAPRSSPATRFSSSVSQRAPEVDRDSEPGSLGEQLASHRAKEAQLPPSDLTDLALEDSSLNAQERAQWDSETPSAREIWQNARRVWQTTSQHAVTWGGQGLKSAQKLARNVNHRLHTRLEEAAQERKRRWEQEKRAEPGPLESREQAFEAVSVRPPMESEPAGVSHTQAPAPPPSAANLAMVQFAKRSIRKAAAPLSAVAAATAVYLGGTHLLGIEGALSLNKMSAPGPEIPNLGTLPSGKASASASVSPASGASNNANKPAAAVPPMQSEQGPMPEGLSWPGKGLIEVVTSEDELIYIDGVFTGRGPLRRVPVTPGKHHVAIKIGGSERAGTVEVLADKNTRAVFKAKGAASPSE